MGRSLPNRGAEQVVTGTLQYLTDLTLPGMLHGKVVRSPVAHGWLRSLRVDSARVVPGVAVVLTAADVPENVSGLLVPDQPVLVEDHIRQFGDALALVAAETMEAAEAAASTVELEIEPLSVLEDPEFALDASTPKLHDGGNLISQFEHERGDVEAAISGAALVIERTVHTHSQEHVCLEPGGGVGLYRDGEYTIWYGTQLPEKVQFEVARAMKVEPGDVRVISTPIGGAFGAKGDGPVPIFLALLAKATGRPVRIALSREEVMAVGSKRHPFRIHTRLALDAQGGILAVDTDALADGGPYASFTPMVLGVAAELSAGPYRNPNARFRGKAVYTNNGNAGGFRGYGAPQVAFALETALDEAAARLTLDPAEIRARNLLRPGDPQSMYGHRIGQSFRLVEALAAVVEHPWWKERTWWREEMTEPWARGTGLAVAFKGCGYGSAKGDNAGARLAISPEGAIRIWAGPNHSGQFIETAYAQIAADTLGRAYEEIEVVLGDTELVPDSGSCAASRSTYVGGSAVQLACRELLARISALGLGDPIDWREAGLQLAAAGQALVEVSFHAPDADLPTEDLKRLTPHRVYGSAAQVVRVEVNRLTGEVVVKGVACAVDCGVAINPAGVVGQTEGGIAQGIGWAVMEDFRLDQGIPQTKSLETYLIPTAADAPEMDVILVESHEDTGPFGAKGIAEVVLVPTAPAVIAAIRDAVGVDVRTLPACPERVYRLMQGMGS